MQVVNVHDAKTNLSQLLQQVALGNDVIIGRSGTPFAKLIPYSHPKQKKRILGKFAGKIWISDDFNDEDPIINELFS